MDRFFLFQAQRLLFGLLLIFLAGLGKLWADFGTIWAPVLVLAIAAGIGVAVLFVLRHVLRGRD